MSESIVALLGQRDEPTDAVEQYCVHLGAALRAHDFAMEIVPAAVEQLRELSPTYRKEAATRS